MEDIRIVKSLKTQLSNKEVELKGLREQFKQLKNDIHRKQQSTDKLKKRIEMIETNTNLHVSEHALLRYIERVLGIDIKDIENEILSDDVKNLIEQLGGNGKYPNMSKTKEPYQVVMKNNVVTTIIKK